LGWEGHFKISAFSRTVIENSVTTLESQQRIWSLIIPIFSGNQRDRTKALEYLDQVGLRDRTQEKAAHLSGRKL